MPVRLLRRCESPLESVRSQALAHMRIFRDVAIIVIVHERMTVHPVVERESNHGKQQRRDRDSVSQQLDLTTGDTGDADTFCTSIYVIRVTSVTDMRQPNPIQPQRTRRTQMHFNEVSGEVVDAAMKVHSRLGAGLLDTVYEVCLAYELNQRGFRSASQLPLPVVYRGVRIDLGFRLDILVENLIVVEIKAVDAITPVHQAQLLTYLTLTQTPVHLFLTLHLV